MDNEFLSFLNPKRLILTANRRLAGYISDQYDLAQSRQNLIWETLQVMPWSSWLRQLWLFNFCGNERLLSASQEHYLWVQVIGQTQKDGGSMLDITKTADLIQDAWRLLHDWQITWDDINQYALTAEVELFNQCAAAFHQYCIQHSWISEAELAPRLQLALESSTLSCQEPLLIAGFDDMPKALSQLIQVIRRNTAVKELPPFDLAKDQSIHYQTANFPDPDSEFMQMALWAKAKLEAHPDFKLGCIIPQLTQYRSTIIDIFKKVITTHSFNISAGQYLSELDIIAVALESLSLAATAKIPLDKLGDFLQSPYLCQNESDRDIGAQIDVSCRKWRRFELNLTDLYPVMTQWQAHYPGHTWLNRWRKFLLQADKIRFLQQPFSHWAQAFSQLLNAIGWPGARSLDSLEYQVIARWQELLQEFSELDAVSGIVNFTSAWQCLRDLTSTTLFQAKNSRTQIEILGVLESNGLRFDAIWIAGMDDRHWPTPADPNPFLPYALQIKHRLPHSSSSREFDFAKKITQRLLHCASDIQISCSGEGAHAISRFSPLIPSGLHPLTSTTVPLELTRKYRPAGKEYYQDESGPLLKPGEKIQGGSTIFHRQAECPFQAFAHIRLKAEAMEEPELGISLRSQGILVHRILEEIWRLMQNQENLIQKHDTELTGLLEKIIDNAIHEEFTHLEPVFIQVEKNRLLSLILDWLNLEKQRPPFSIFALEREIFLKIGEIPLHLKIDRIDQLANGLLLLIDYKTGNINIKNWIKQRLQSIQLPLYAMDDNLQKNLAGVAFAQVQSAHPNFKGWHDEYLDNSQFPAGITGFNQIKEIDAPQTWRDLLQHWRQALEKLAADFSHGYAAVDPIEHDKTCQKCDLQSLCRIKNYVGR